jgi:lipopolysaccharide transport system permease protein
MFLSPVAYPISELKNIPEKWRTLCEVLYSLNPMAGVIEGFKWAMLDGPHASWLMMLVSMCATLLLLVGGLYYFRRMEKTFADFV